MNVPRVAFLFIPPVLCVFYLFVLFEAANPVVSDNYRLYYIERRLRDWNKGAGLSYDLGTTIEFSRAVPFLSRRGWSSPEAWGTWSEGSSSELFLAISGCARPRLLELKGHAFLAPANGVVRQVVNLYVNNRFAGSSAVTSAGEQNLEFPIDPSVGSGCLLSLRFEYPDAVSPRKLGLSDDGRRLGFGFVEMAVR
jgi:hypothetical protein